MTSKRDLQQLFALADDLLKPAPVLSLTVGAVRCPVIDRDDAETVWQLFLAVNGLPASTPMPQLEIAGAA